MAPPCLAPELRAPGSNPGGASRRSRTAPHLPSRCCQSRSSQPSTPLLEAGDPARARWEPRRTAGSPSSTQGAQPTIHHHIKFIISSGTNTLVDAHDDNHTAQDLPAFEFLPNHNTPHSPPRKGERPLQPSASPLPPISTAEQSRAAPQLQVE